MDLEPTGGSTNADGRFPVCECLDSGYDCGNNGSLIRDDLAATSVVSHTKDGAEQDDPTGTVEKKDSFLKAIELVDRWFASTVWQGPDVPHDYVPDFEKLPTSDEIN
jgi:hypothetical protein